jgi:hypothetical protein
MSPLPPPSIEKIQKIGQERGGQCLSEKYIDSHTKLHWRCAKGHEWDALWNSIQQGGWCPICAGKQPVSIERCKQWALRLGGECLSTEYVNAHFKMRWRCAHGHEWDSIWNNIQQGKWCPFCTGKAPVVIDRCKQEALKRGGECLSKEFINAHAKLYWRCGKGHQWNATWSDIHEGCWCPICSKERRGVSLRTGIEECQEHAIKLGGECLSTNYINNQTKLHWRCKKGHEWDACWRDIHSGKWCPTCGREKTNNALENRYVFSSLNLHFMSNEISV